jgi:hypothetical protein
MAALSVVRNKKKVKQMSVILIIKENNDRFKSL